MSAASLATTLVQGAVARTRAAYRPAPSLFLYPGLTARPFWDPSLFRWAGALAERTPAILAEYDALAAARAPSDYEVGEGEHTLHQGDWAWHSIVTKGVVQSRLAVSCPATYEALLGTVGGELLTAGVPFAYAFFSTLRGGAAIAPHFGPSNTRLRVHLPLRVPTDDPLRCGIAVGGQTAAWVPGRPLIFDDSFEHATHNSTAADRVLLLFDVWHPDLAPEERSSLAAMFAYARGQNWLKPQGQQ